MCSLSSSLRLHIPSSLDKLCLLRSRKNLIWSSVWTSIHNTEKMDRNLSERSEQSLSSEELECKPSELSEGAQRPINADRPRKLLGAKGIRTTYFCYMWFTTSGIFRADNGLLIWWKLQFFLFDLVCDFTVFFSGANPPVHRSQSVLHFQCHPVLRLCYPRRCRKKKSIGCDPTRFVCLFMLIWNLIQCHSSIFQDWILKLPSGSWKTEMSWDMALMQ